MKLLGTMLLALGIAGTSHATEMLQNGDFELGGDFWYEFTDSYYDYISYAERSPGWGVDAIFELSASNPQPFSSQMFQTNLAVQPGYRYTVSYGGSATAEGSKWVGVGIQHNGGAYNGDGSQVWTVYDSLSRTFTTTYSEHSKSWDNCSVTDGFVQFYVHAGLNSLDFNLAWVSLDRTPITCPNSSSSSAPSSSSSAISSSSSIPISSSSLSPSNAVVYMNQVAFLNQGSKRAVILQGTTDSIRVQNSQGTTVGTFLPSIASTWAPSGQSARLVDFSSIKDSGSYTLWQGSTQIGRTFKIEPRAYENVVKGGLKFYYFQRASAALLSTYAGSYARSSGHPDNSVSKYYVGGGSGISAPKGWYDAGDYGKYIVNSGISTATLMSLYEHYPLWFDSLTWNIPESGNGQADLLNEIKWNLDWMLQMQDADGGIFSKLTTAVFSGTVMPSADVANLSHF